MTREEAIKRLSDELMFLMRPNVNNGSGLEKKIEVCRMAIDAIREQEERRWIPVTERLPDIGKVVLIYSKEDDVEVDYYGGDMFGYCNVTHWMPLPEPPKEDKP